LNLLLLFAQYKYNSTTWIQ